MKTESIGLMEPLLPPEEQPELTDLALKLAEKAGGLAEKLHPIVQRAVGELVRSMNCYYSNLIEGHDTHPRDIDRALSRDYSQEPAKRALQKEAVAHIEVQRMIDEGKAPDVEPTRRTYLLWLHREFCGRMPEDLLWVRNPDTEERLRVAPGELRDRTVAVGRHVPPRPENLDAFLGRFEEAYGRSGLSRTSRIFAVGAAHHRLLWIHPFLDGNGRVARLTSYAMLRRLGVGSPLWSVARGLARRVSDYRRLLENADGPRAGNYDGRGTLSERALVDFCRFFLEVSIDQVEYMSSLLEPSELLNRMRIHVEEEIGLGRLPERSFPLLREALTAGEFERGRAPALTGYRERRAREVLSRLVEKGLLLSDGPKKPVRLGFPIDVVERWFPLLYPVRI